jgi:hypothetical protein
MMSFLAANFKCKTNLGYKKKQIPKMLQTGKGLYKQLNLLINMLRTQNVFFRSHCNDGTNGDDVPVALPKMVL